MPETITITVPASAIDVAIRDRIVSLEDEHHAVLAAVGPLDGETLSEAVSRICREGEGARADASSAVAIAIRQALGAKPDERTVDAAGRVAHERDEARADLAVAENTLATALRSRDEWFDAHEAMRQEREDMRHERDAAKASVYALTTERDEEKARRLEAERELELASAFLSHRECIARGRSEILRDARRFIRDQVEGLRGEYPDPAALEQAFLTFGEYAIAPGFELKPWLAHCIAQPAARRADTDYQALDPNP